MSRSKSDNSLLELEQVAIRSGSNYLVKELSFALQARSSLGIVGESGSGKSLTSLAIMGLLPSGLSLEGSIRWRGQELSGLTQAQHRALRGPEMAMIFQEPMSALNPSMTCGAQVLEMLERRRSGKTKKQQVIALFEEVELPRASTLYHSYPHQLSGGQKQRVMIAMALAADPALLIADEPTTALDVSVQAGILALLKKLQERHDMAMLFISHDLRVVRKVSDQVLVMQKGVVKEYGSVEQVFQNPRDPYTKGLLACRPKPDTYLKRLPLVRDFQRKSGPATPLRSQAERLAEAKEKLNSKPLFEICQLSKFFKSDAGFLAKETSVVALSSVDLRVYPGESLGLVGESGSGKTTLGRILVGLEKASQGQIFYRGQDIAKAKRADWRKLNRQIQIIFQDPFASLNPKQRVGETIAEVLRERRGYKTAKARQEAEVLLEKVGLLPAYYQRYPHEFSGGQRQRIGIARALAVDPEFIVCDESVSALDVSVQAQILNLLNDLKEEFGLTYLFISHDLNVVKYFCDRMVVLQNGKAVEEGLTEELYYQAQQPYTQQLIEAGKEL